MEENIVDEEIIGFVKTHISSVLQLEILLLFHANPQRKWPIDQIVRELRTDLEGTRQQLAVLREHALVKGEDLNGYYFAPANENVDVVVSGLAQLYRLRRVAVVTLIFSPR